MMDEEIMYDGKVRGGPTFTREELNLILAMTVRVAKDLPKDTEIYRRVEALARKVA